MLRVSSYTVFIFLCFKNNNLERSTSDNTGVNSHLILSQRPHIDPLMIYSFFLPPLAPPLRIPPFHTSL